MPQVDITAPEASIAEVASTWEERLAKGLTVIEGEDAALEMRYLHAFSVGYAETFSPARALEDIRRIEWLATARESIAINFYREAEQQPCRLRATIYRFGDPIRLSERVPILENLGFSVIDERSHRIRPRFGDREDQVTLHDMELESADGSPLDLDACNQRLMDCFLAVFRKAAENDGFNRVVMTTGANWREAAILRSYAIYLRQLGVPYGLRFLAETLNQHAGIVRDLLELFHVRFDPDRALPSLGARRSAEAPVRARLDGALALVPSLDEDRILRHMLNLVSATLRTNFFQRDDAGNPPTTIVFKFSSKDVDASPQPRPFVETWVYSPRVEGIHLRFAPIARGGIRWSDRAQDFRTEVLGLARAQLVKNAVIVPAGAKGGFLPKQLPRTGTRDDLMKEGVAAYRTFVGSLLQISDNLRNGVVVSPSRLVRHDGDDPYLVVAADKGTATFSDIANEIASDHGYWLGDAFASGGSAGYDHKKMAITARGAWECVQRHFREMDWDLQIKPFRVVGVGDMSGDVFGNGMLLSPVIRLVAAFDHRDIFLDPNPDCASSFAERQRLFHLPRSSWADYDRSKISAGGGVFSRNAKSIGLSDEIRELLGLGSKAVTPTGLMRAILSCNTDLLWFGGVGTYVRASTETDEQVGDRANDAVRITASAVRAKVIAEGANLALTQQGRIKFASRGGRLNTDFIDNSAGVNSSDIEVNIKIALGTIMQAGSLDMPSRNALLTRMTDDVAASCLRNNYQQALALSLAERRASAESGLFAHLLRDLENRKLLARKLEALPSEIELAKRQVAGRPLTRPELACLLSYSKIALAHDLLASNVPDEPRLESWLLDYFPTELRHSYAPCIKNHRLRREIIATVLANDTVNSGGLTLGMQCVDETGCSPAEVALAYLATRDIFGTAPLAHEIDALAGQITGVAQVDLRLVLQDFVRRTTLSFLKDRQALTDLDATIRIHATAAETLRSGLEGMLPPAEAGLFAERRSRYAAMRAPPSLAQDLAALEVLAHALAIRMISGETSRSIGAVAPVYFSVGEHLRVSELTARAASVPSSDYFDRMAIGQSLDLLNAAQRTFTCRVLVAQAAPSNVADWINSQGGPLARVKTKLDEIVASKSLTVPQLTVAAGCLHSLAVDRHNFGVGGSLLLTKQAPDLLPQSSDAM